MDNKFRSRKFLVTLLVQVPASFAMATGKITGADYAMISSAVIASYSFANVAAAFAQRDVGSP